MWIGGKSKAWRIYILISFIVAMIVIGSRVVYIVFYVQSTPKTTYYSVAEDPWRAQLSVQPASPADFLIVAYMNDLTDLWEADSVVVSYDVGYHTDSHTLQRDADEAFSTEKLQEVLSFDIPNPDHVQPENPTVTVTVDGQTWTLSLELGQLDWRR